MTRLAESPPPVAALARVAAETRLLHIGPPGPGTAAIQQALHRRRVALREAGVHLAGRNREAARAAAAVTRAASPYAPGVAPERWWPELLREIDASGSDRVVISSAGFADADARAIQSIVDDLGSGSVHVLLTVLASPERLAWAWQDALQDGLTVSYEAWLAAVLDGPAAASALNEQFRNDRVVAPWAAAVGAENVTVLVHDGDHSGLLEGFEALLGLQPGTLAADPAPPPRSLSFAEAEAVRAFNRLFRAEGLPRRLHAQVVRFGMAEQLRRRDQDPGEAAIDTPPWALTRATELQAEVVAALRALGVGLVLPRIAPPRAPSADAPATTSDEVWTRIGGSAAAGVALAAGVTPGGPWPDAADPAWPDGPIDWGPLPPRARNEPVELAMLSTSALAGILARRYWTVALRRLGLLRSPG